MKHKKILTIALAGIISLNLGMQKFSLTPKTVYHVYLKGKSIGLVESKEDLEKYIDREQESLKEKYNIKKVYAPDELDIKKEITYKEDISSSEEIYTKIKDSSSFSIDGYEINIKKEIASKEEDKTETKNIKIYVIDKKVFTDSIDKTVKSFITNEDYIKNIH